MCMCTNVNVYTYVHVCVHMCAALGPELHCWGPAGGVHLWPWPSCTPVGQGTAKEVIHHMYVHIQ